MPDAPTVPLGSFLDRPSASGPQIVALPAGTKIPIKVETSGDLFGSDQEAVWPLVLARPIEVMMVDGQLTGEFRLIGEGWLRVQETLMTRVPWVRARLTPKEGPMVHTSLVVKILDKSVHSTGN